MAIIFNSNYSGDYGYLYEFKAEATETKDSDYISTNKTTVTVKTYLRRTNSSSNGAYNLSGTDWSIIIDGSETSGNNSWDTRNTSDWQLIGSATKKISHNTDGSKTIEISASHTGNSASGSSKMGNASGSGTFKLTTIPRASSVSGGSGNIEETSTISITKASNSFTHTLRYVFGNLSDTIITKTSSTSISWKIPNSFYAQIPDSQSGTGIIYCDTYSGNTLIGTKSTSFMATAKKSSCIPTLSASIIDINPTTTVLTGDSAKLIKYKSTAQLIITSVVKNSSSIKNITVNGISVGKTETIQLNYTNVSTTSFSIIVTDSRGYQSETKIITPTYINYVPLTLKSNFFRPQPTTGEIQLTYSGNYFDGSFGSVSNELSIEWEYKESSSSDWILGGRITPTISESTISSSTINLGTNFDYQKAYDFRISAIDKLSTVITTKTVSVGMPVFYWGKDFINFTENPNLYKSEGNTRYYAERTDTGTGIWLGIEEEGTNHGLYSIPQGQWMIYSDGSNVHILKNLTFDEDGNIITNGNIYANGNALYIGGNKHNDDEKTIYYNNTNSSDTPYPHNLRIYGGNGTSATALGLYDANTSQIICRYLDGINNNFQFNLETQLTHGSYPIESVVTKSVSNNTGVIHFKSGLLLQWGTVNITPSAANTPTGKSITFTKSYDYTPIVMTTANTTVIGSTVLGTSTSNVSKTGADIYVTRSNTTVCGVKWFSIGLKEI